MGSGSVWDMWDLNLGGNVQLGGVQLHQVVQPTEHQDGDYDGEVAYQFTQLEHTLRRSGGGGGPLYENGAHK